MNPPEDLTLLEHALLALTAQQPRSGYDLKKLFETTAMQQFSSSPGSIYPALQRLDRRGFLASVERANGDRTRRVYRPTASGMRELKAWLLAPVTLDEMQRDGRSPVLRFAFLGVIDADRTATQAFLTSYRRALDPYLEELRAVAEEFDDESDPHPRLAILHGVEQVKGQIRWVERAERALGTAPKTGEKTR